MDVFDLVAKITLDTSQYDSELQGAEQSASSFGQKLKGGLGTAAKVGLGAVAAIGTASTVASAAFVKGAGDVAKYGDNIDKMSQKMGMSSDAYQEWDAVMRHSGTSMETMKASMKTLANAAENGSEAFDKLGISQEEIAGMSQEQLFERTITALQGVEDETERTYLAGKTLGRGATELGALLNMSAEDTEKMRKRTRELGGVMSKQAVKASAKYQDSLQDMQTAISGVKNNLMAEFLPSLTTVMDGVTEIFSGDSNKGIGMISKGIDNLVSKIGQKIPKFLEIGGKIVSSLSTVIAQNLPKIITSVVNFISANLPGAITGLIKILVPAVTSLVTAVGKSLPTLLKGLVGTVKEVAPLVVDAIKGIGTSVIGWFTSNGGQIFEKAKEVFGKIKDAVGDAVSKIPEKLGEIITSITTWVQDNGGTVLSKAKELFNNIVDGIKDAVGKIPGALADIITNIGSWVTTHGAEILAVGQNILSWIVSGIKAFIGDIANGFVNLVSTITSWVTSHGSDILAVGQNILGWIASGIKKFITDIWNGFTSFIATLLGWTDDNSGDIEDVGKSILDYIAGGIGKFIGRIKLGFTGLVGKITEKVTDIGGKLKEIGGTIVDKIRGGIYGFMARIKNGFNNMGKNIEEKVTSTVVTDKLKALGGKIVDAIADGITGISKLAEKIKGLIQAAVADATKTQVNANVKIAAQTGYTAGSEGHLPQAKAQFQPRLFNKKTIFGRYSDKNLVAGEAEPEMLLGVNKLNRMMYESVQGGMSAVMGQMLDYIKGTQTNGASVALQQEIINVLNAYLPQLANMQVVMDSGALVGAVAPGVDSALGGTASNKRRYNA